METEGSSPHSHQSPLLSTLIHINQVHNLPTDFLKTYFNIIPSPTRRSSNWPLSFRIPHKKPAFTSQLLHTCYMLRPSHSYYLITLVIFGEDYKLRIPLLGISIIVVIIIIVIYYSSVLLKMTRGTNLMQELWFIIINICTCFGRLYVHLQEYSWRWVYRCPKHVQIFMIINHNCCIKLVPLVIIINDAGHTYIKFRFIVHLRRTYY